MSMQQQQQQQRKTLFTPYLPQATLPALLGDGQLVAGILRVNKKNRSDAYVTTDDLDADIFICGSKDRNRALEGDYVAIELLDVNEVWGQKREKEEKKKRKDNNDRSGSIAVNDATTQPESSQGNEGGIRRRGSLRQRPTQKKNDDVEVEGQSLLLMEEEEINDEQKPLYAGHVVAVIERVAGQMFSGTLGLLRPSSQATKEKQEAERQAREGGSGRQQPERQQDKPKIVWFKPTDKRVPLIAIPTEQAPRDFVERHQDYSNRIFVACIKRWPITSLHPFGTLVEQLGEMGDLKVETDALLRDNNFGPDDFTDAVLKNIGFEGWSVANDGEAAFASRRDFRQEKSFTIDPNGTKELDNAIHIKSLENGRMEIGFHVADVAHFIKANSPLDREAKKRGTAVYLMDRTVNMLPQRLSHDICSLTPDEERYTISIVFTVDANTGRVSDEETWVGKGVVKSTGKLSYDDINDILSGSASKDVYENQTKDIKLLHKLTGQFRQARLGQDSSNITPLRLLCQLEDENVPVVGNIFNSSVAQEMFEELAYKANAFVAQKIANGLPEKALLRRHPAPNPRRLKTFSERMTAIGYQIDTSSSGSLQNSLFKIDDVDIRKGMQTLLVKTMQRAKYSVLGKTYEEQRPHYALNMPLYTHFTNPLRRYVDIVVHRQLDSVLSDGAVDFQDDIESLAKTAESCNTKKDSAHSAQEQSVHIESCRKMDKIRQDLGGELISEGIVLCVYESAFDVLIPEYGFEKRVHCDQLPLKKAEFDKNKRLLELYWEKGVPSATYVPEDERPKHSNTRAAHAQAAAREAENARQRAKEHEEARRRNLDTGTMTTDDVDALFDDDDDVASEITDKAAGVSLNQQSDRSTQSVPSSPTAKSAHSRVSGEHLSSPHRTNSDSKLVQAASGETSDNTVSNKEKYLKLFTLREENGDYIQDVKEMTRVPVILKTDLSKSPPCLTIRSLNPYAL
jgi:protein SSD1